MPASEGNFQRTARAYLAAIDKYNGKTNAILTKLEELAMEQAARTQCLSEPDIPQPRLAHSYSSRCAQRSRAPSFC